MKPADIELVVYRARDRFKVGTTEWTVLSVLADELIRWSLEHEVFGSTELRKEE
jgi:hypothetical protein